MALVRHTEHIEFAGQQQWPAPATRCFAEPPAPVSLSSNRAGLSRPERPVKSWSGANHSSDRSHNQTPEENRSGGSGNLLHS